MSTVIYSMYIKHKKKHDVFYGTKHIFILLVIHSQQLSMSSELVIS